MSPVLNLRNITRIDTHEDDMWDRIVDYYFDHVWPGGPSSIVNWVEDEYHCKLDGRFATFNSPAEATLFSLRWA